MDDGGAFRLEPDRDPRAGEPRAVVGDEGDVGDATDANDAGLAAALSDAVADGLQNGAVVEIRDRAPDRRRKGGADRDDDLGRVVTLRCVSPSATIGSASLTSPRSSAGATTWGNDWRSAQRSPSSR